LDHAGYRGFYFHGAGREAPDTRGINARVDLYLSDDQRIAGASLQRKPGKSGSSGRIPANLKTIPAGRCVKRDQQAAMHFNGLTWSPVLNSRLRLCIPI
jgi:hypothetical protein